MLAVFLRLFDKTNKNINKTSGQTTLQTNKSNKNEYFFRMLIHAHCNENLLP